MTALAPHRLNRGLRPAWFFEREAYGGIINDIGLHSIDTFMAFAGTSDPVIARDVAKQIEEELTYPGQIRITVVRESRATEYAK